MEKQEIKVIAVDDDEINLDIITKNLKDAGYNTKAFLCGLAAWEYMKENPQECSIALLDKMMPKIDGIQLLRNMKANLDLKNIPVIIQTGDTRIESMQLGLEAGAYYYLHKPFDPSIMISLVNSAAKEYILRQKILKRSTSEKQLLQMLTLASFQIFSVENAKSLALSLSNISKNPNSTAFALTELMVNSIEHGNLDIGYEKKNHLLITKTLEEEINKRLSIDKYKNKYSLVNFKKEKNYNQVTIIDQGKGFNWKEYIEFNPSRLKDCNGRGIATASLMDIEIKYEDNGTKAICLFE